VYNFGLLCKTFWIIILGVPSCKFWWAVDFSGLCQQNSLVRSASSSCVYGHPGDSWFPTCPLFLNLLNQLQIVVLTGGSPHVWQKLHSTVTAYGQPNDALCSLLHDCHHTNCSSGSFYYNWKQSTHVHGVCAKMCVCVCVFVCVCVCARARVCARVRMPWELINTLQQIPSLLFCSWKLLHPESSSLIFYDSVYWVWGWSA
jgi:hypothetical protein